ncbi:MAG: M20 family metallo-hydrolase [Bacteroidales bacterium]|nr:M20 family metallo-hydrolase [Bacteroidales bacterium]MCM1146857.1 M20 family metallo-hydrolase [Bacteroidales bacterium]MCM1205645.1 M20 family metallo-hydrolase [Bacillota bacterium]MCM1510243.1 M20 family metallo-hydrolase [Clostridium sp.]
MDKERIIMEAVELLCSLIATPRTSREETAAADIMERWMTGRGMSPVRFGNNILLVCPDYSEERETVMLNAHIDTVKPVASWRRDPYSPAIEGDMLYGIGSNDCGGGLVTLLQVYRILTGTERKYNIVYLASCEEEVSGANGIRRVIPGLPAVAPGIKVDVAIVGEPTGMQPAVAEKGLMVVDMTARGKSGHAARNEGVNAIYEALDDMMWIRNHKFEKVSEFLGPTRMSLTVINAGTQHNVVPDECRMVIDVRSNEHYTNEEIFDEIGKNVRSEIKARSFHLRSSHISTDHPLIKRCIAMGMKPFGSPTLSDQALMPWQSFKLGPGESARSHSADEYIKISELRHALDVYLELLS